MNFPQASNINSTIFETINDRVGNNINMSGIKPWIRLIAATNGGLIIESLPIGDSFSSRYGNGNRSGRIGVNWIGEDVFEDESSRAFRPSPIVENLSVLNGTEGLSRKISFIIKCFTLGQTEKIMKYFQEPGYTVLVEYGWNLPLSVQQKCTKTKEKDFLCNMVSYNSLSVLHKKRKDSKGTYDAFLGYITGGGMKYGDGESFDVSVELTTLGEIPAYFQPQKGSATAFKNGNGTNDTSTKVYTPFEIEKAVDSKDIGRALFMQMFNGLPGQKRTKEVKKLIDLNEYRQFGTNKKNLGPIASPSNFINMDDGVRQTLIDDLSNAEVRLQEDATSSSSSAKVPAGVQLISDERFIRLGLAFQILNTTERKFEPIQSACSGPTLNFTISPHYAICRSHKHMFSADPSKLLIPNKQAPEFGLKSALTETTPQTSFIDLNNIETNIVDIHPEGDIKRYFPNEDNLSETGIPGTTSYDWDSDYVPLVADARQYGLLTDLFINFDFFVSCIEKNGFVVKDIVLDMLNGISSAVNMYWDFQINEQTDDNGFIELVIKDNSFCGKKINTDSVKKWQSRGLDSPFLDTSLNFDIPGAMANHILTKRLQDNKDSEESLVIDGRQVPVDGLFATSNDPVLDILNGMKKIGEESSQETNSEEEVVIEETVPTEEDIRKSNYELFMGSASVYPKVQDRNGNTDVEVDWYDFIRDTNSTTLEELFFVGAWKDMRLLKIVELMDEGKITEAPVKNSDGDIGGETNNPQLLPITFSFTLPGVSGLLIGSVFKIKDLPKKYRNRLFAITKIEHTIGDNGWTTTVESQIRNQT